MHLIKRKGSRLYFSNCMTITFMFGAIVGVFTTHSSGSWSRDAVIIGLATVAFHLTNINPKTLLNRFNKAP